jgi:hypothetical protein
VWTGSAGSDRVQLLAFFEKGNEHLASTKGGEFLH